MCFERFSFSFFSFNFLMILIAPVIVQFLANLEEFLNRNERLHFQHFLVLIIRLE